MLISSLINQRLEKATRLIESEPRRAIPSLDSLYDAYSVTPKNIMRHVRKNLKSRLIDDRTAVLYVDPLMIPLPEIRGKMS